MEQANKRLGKAERRMMALFLVLSLLLGLCAEIAAGSEETIKEKYVIPITNINVRTGPSTKYSIILHSTGASGGTMGMLMKYQSTVNGWYKVLLPEGTEAYVNGASEYCELHEFVYTRTEYENYCQVLKEAGFPEATGRSCFICIFCIRTGYSGRCRPAWTGTRS